MKKGLSVILMLAMILSLIGMTSCANSQPSPDDAGGSATTTTASSTVSVDPGNATLVPDYNNAVALTEELNRILSEAISYSMSFARIFSPNEQKMDCYRRDVSVFFEAADYIAVRNIICNLDHIKYGGLVQSVSIAESEDSDKNPILSVSVNVSFFEYEKRGSGESEPPTGRHTHDIRNFISEEEAALVDRVDLLDMLQNELFGQAHLTALAIYDNEVITQFSGITFQQVGAIQEKLLENPLVDNAFLSSGSSNKDDTTNVMTLIVKNPE